MFNHQSPYTGRLLVANPTNPKDKLSHSVILITSHGAAGSTGLQLNRPMDNFTLSDVCGQMGIFLGPRHPVYVGGFSSPNKIFIVHSNDWSGVGTVKYNDEISVTRDVSILSALADQQGPKFFRACAGIRTWSEQALDRQIEDPKSLYKWEIAPAESSIVFHEGDPSQVWRAGLTLSAKFQVSTWF